MAVEVGDIIIGVGIVGRLLLYFAQTFQCLVVFLEFHVVGGDGVEVVGLPRLIFQSFFEKFDGLAALATVAEDITESRITRPYHRVDFQCFVEVVFGGLQVVEAVIAVADGGVYHRSLHSVAQCFLKGVDGFLVAAQVVVDVGQVHVGPEVFGVDGEGKLVWVDAFLIFAHHAVAVADVGPGFAVVRVKVDEVLEKGDGFFLFALAEVAGAYRVVDGVAFVEVVVD